jgi:hypothetical protein
MARSVSVHRGGVAPCGFFMGPSCLTTAFLTEDLENFLDRVNHDALMSKLAVSD